MAEQYDVDRAVRRIAAAVVKPRFDADDRALRQFSLHEELIAVIDAVLLMTIVVVRKLRRAVFGIQIPVSVLTAGRIESVPCGTGCGKGNERAAVRERDRLRNADADRPQRQIDRDGDGAFRHHKRIVCDRDRFVVRVDDGNGVFIERRVHADGDRLAGGAERCRFAVHEVVNAASAKRLRRIDHDGDRIARFKRRADRDVLCRHGEFEIIAECDRIAVRVGDRDRTHDIALIRRVIHRDLRSRRRA